MARCPSPRPAASWVGLLILIVLVAAGCGSRQQPADVSMDWELAPGSPRVGPATLTLTLTDSTGQLVEDARVEVEANMAHPGMQPVVGAADEVSPGRYVASFSWTMAGDWFVLVRSTLNDGRDAQWQIDVPTVRRSE